MSYIAVASAKGSPGVTTAVAALAATWPTDRELVVVELDPSGGDLAVRFDLAPEPGLVSLAAAGRRQLGPATLREHTQELASVVGDDVQPRRALVGPVSGDQAAAALTALRSALPPVLSDLGCDVLVDCGRLEPQSPAFEVATKADLLVVVARPVVAEVHHLATRLASTRAGAVSLLLVGDRPYSVAEVADAVAAHPLGTLPADARAAAALAGGHRNAARALRRSSLMRDAAAIADGLATWLGPVVGDAAPTGPPTVETVLPPAPPPPGAPSSPRAAPRSPVGWPPATPPSPPPAPPAPAGPRRSTSPVPAGPPPPPAPYPVPGSAAAVPPTPPSGPAAAAPSNGAGSPLARRRAARRDEPADEPADDAPRPKHFRRDSAQATEERRR